MKVLRTILIILLVLTVLLVSAVAVIGYANGYYRYLAPKQAYENGWYEAMAAILAPGEGERLVSEMKKLLGQLEEM